LHCLSTSVYGQMAGFYKDGDEVSGHQISLLSKNLVSQDSAVQI